MKFLFKLYLIIITLYLFVSCDLFLSVPRGRENINDDAAQITAFTAVPSGDKSVVTMWNWKDAPDWLNLEDRIEEIKIIHSSIGYPEVNFPFAGETFTDNSRWQYEWKDLKPDSTHYFSLFAKDNRGNWYAPLKVKVKLSGTTVITGKNYSAVGSLNVNDASSADINPLSLDINSTAVAVIFFDFDNSYVTEATIAISVTIVSGAGDIQIAPLTGYLPQDDLDKWKVLDNNSIVRQDIGIVFQVSSAGNISLDISDIVKYMPINLEKALLIRTTDGTADISLDAAPVITADIFK